MSDNPYANDYGDETMHDGPPRTSALAVTSLVMSLICCIPVVPLLGAGVGVGALIGIGGSRGRVGGKGLAIAGIIIGALVTAAQVGAVISFQQFMDMGVKLVYGSANDVMADIEAGDYDAARAGLVGNAATLGDERFEAFKAAYQAEHGAFQSVPTGIGDLFTAYSQMGPQMQNYQPPQGGPQNVIPAPANFDGGLVLLIAEIAQNGQPKGQPGSPDFRMPLRDLRIVMPDGSELSLLAGPQGGSGAAPGGGQPGDESTGSETTEDDGP